MSLGKPGILTAATVQESALAKRERTVIAVVGAVRVPSFVTNSDKD